MNWHLMLNTLAQESKPPISDEAVSAGSKAAQPVNPVSPRPTGPMDNLLFPLGLLAMVVLMFVMSSRQQKAERRKLQDMLGALKKGDKVVTVGGMVGTIIETREKVVVLKIDEHTQTKCQFTLDAIRGRFDDEVAKVEKVEKTDKA